MVTNDFLKDLLILVGAATLTAVVVDVLRGRQRDRTVTTIVPRPGGGYDIIKE